MYMNTPVSYDLFKHICVSSGVFEHICVVCSFEAPPVLSGVFKRMCLLKFLKACFWCFLVQLCLVLCLTTPTEGGTENSCRMPLCNTDTLRLTQFTLRKSRRKSNVDLQLMCRLRGSVSRLSQIWRP